MFRTARRSDLPAIVGLLASEDEVIDAAAADVDDASARGFDRDLLARAIERERARGCTLVQLTSNQRRTEAHRLYRSLGFVASHEGFRLLL